MDEDAGLVRLGGWATDIRPGPQAATDEAGQSGTFIASVTSLQGGLSFAVPPTIQSSTGDLVFQTSADKHGTATLVVRLQDNASGFSPHVNISAPRTVTISVNSVNDPPQFTPGADQRTTEDAGPQNVNGWPTGIRPGPLSATDELTQSVSFIVTASNPSLFANQPAVSFTR